MKTRLARAMKLNCLLILLLTGGLFTKGLVTGGKAADPPPPDTAADELPTYTILRTTEPIVINGKLDEPSWFAAPEVGEFHFTWYQAGDRERTVTKLLWNDTHLYVACVCQDRHIWATHAERDSNVAEDDCFEIMIAPNPATPEIYFNLEWNVIEGLVDNFRPDGPKKPRAPKWDADGVKIAGSIEGTLNNDEDADRWWIVEAAIPLNNFREVARQDSPVDGTTWHVNLNRHGGKTNVQYSQWSRGDTPTPSFHTPHRFGRMTFSSRSVPFAATDD